MPELSQKQVSARSIRARLLAWTLAALPALTAFPTFAAVESLPASVRACAAETDSLRRLVCYDREVARYPAPAANAAPTPPSATASQPAGASSVATSPAPTPPSTATRAAATTGAQPVASSSNASPPSAENTASAGAGTTHSDPQHLTARIVSIDHRPNELTWHLDNGQVWQEVQSVAGDLSLREGDTVKIDKHLGSYWLSGPHVASMRVRLKE
jgi:hypothetical protein